MSVTTRVYIDGTIHDEATAVVPVFDRGFLYGDSVYEVLRTAGGRPVDLDRHLERLARSANAILLPAPDLTSLAAALYATLAAAANPESYVRVILTRGAGEIGLDLALAEGARTIVLAKPLRLPPPELYERGARVVVVDVIRTPREAVDPAVKSGNYLNNILALAAARRAGADEAVMKNAQGRLAEGSTSNLFVVRGGVVETPALAEGLLPGITRRRVLELARARGLPVAECPLEPSALVAADEAFLTSSLRGVLPVTRVGDAAVGAGIPGPVTRALAAAYTEYLAAVASGANGL